MTLRYHDNAREKIAMDLYEFFEPHGTTDATFDEICGWVDGTTRELLEKIRFPCDGEIIEICVRLNRPLSNYVATREPPSPRPPDPLIPRRCTEQEPCCEHRLEPLIDPNALEEYECPRHCICHS